jgi:hypothetical protein
VVDAAEFERRGIPAAVIGLTQLLETVGRATAKTMNMPDLRFVHIPDDLHHALDYIPDQSDFWDRCVDSLLPRVKAALIEPGDHTQGNGRR